MSLRIASYYPDQKIVGRNDGGPLYHTTCLRRIFGQENVEHLFPKDIPVDIGRFDLHYMVDWGEDALGMQNFEIPHPSVYVTSDTHLGYDYRLSRAKRCDWVFCNQRKAVEDFVRDGVPADRCFWLPHAFDPLAYSPGVFNRNINDWDREAVPLKRFDVCFIGHLNDENRVDHLDRLFKAVPNAFWGVRRFHEAAEVFNASRIVFNVSARRELNMRVFEALGSGAFLLTDRLPEPETPFRDGIHYACYDDIGDMVEKAGFFLESDEKRECIAEAGYLEVLSGHTYMHRVVQVLETIGVRYDRERAAAYMPKVPADALANAVG